MRRSFAGMVNNKVFFSPITQPAGRLAPSSVNVMLSTDSTSKSSSMVTGKVMEFSPLGMVTVPSLGVTSSLPSESSLDFKTTGRGTSAVAVDSTVTKKVSPSSALLDTPAKLTLPASLMASVYLFPVSETPPHSSGKLPSRRGVSVKTTVSLSYSSSGTT